jgi:hypothetical protein
VGRRANDCPWNELNVARTRRRAAHLEILKWARENLGLPVGQGDRASPSGEWEATLEVLRVGARERRARGTRARAEARLRRDTSNPEPPTETDAREFRHNR